MKLLYCYFNQCFNLYITTDGMEEVGSEFTTTKEGIFRLTEYKDNAGNTFYTFGLKAFGVQPGHGGEWSSRPAVINRVFGTELAGVAVTYKANGGYVSMAMRRQDIPISEHYTWRAETPTDNTYGLISPDIEGVNDCWYDNEGNIVNKSNPIVYG